MAAGARHGQLLADVEDGVLVSRLDGLLRRHGALCRHRSTSVRAGRDGRADVLEPIAVEKMAAVAKRTGPEVITARIAPGRLTSVLIGLNSDLLLGFQD